MKAIVQAMVLVMMAAGAAAQDAVMGNTIQINDKSLASWRGTPPQADNTSTYSEGEFIWRDAIGDDKGNGGYHYPMEPVFEMAADLSEFRVTFDKENLYLLIKAEKPKDWWVPYRVVGITTHLPTDGLSQVYPQGKTSENMNEQNSYMGTYGEIKVSKDLAPHFVIGLSGTFKGRIWDKDGKLIAKADGPDSGNDTPGFQIATVDWSGMQVAIPWKVLGVDPPEGQMWKFVVGIGTQDYDRMREVDIEPSQWHGGGGEGRFNDDGPDPDLYDLASPSAEKQAEDLGGFTAGNPDPSAYSEIKNSFLEVKFGKLK